MHNATIVRLRHTDDFIYSAWLKALGFCVLFSDSIMPRAYDNQFCDGTDEGVIAQEHLNSLYKVFCEIKRRDRALFA